MDEAGMYDDHKLQKNKLPVELEMDGGPPDRIRASLTDEGRADLT